jgi:CBS domain-containing protein
VHISSVLFNKGDSVNTIEPERSVADAARTLAVHRVGALVVSTDGEHIDGIISERDITWAVGNRGPDALDMRVADLMTREVSTCAPGDTTDGLMKVMTERRIRHLPVVGDDGRLCGIVSIGDVVKHRLHELETETDTLHEYLNSGR